MGLRDVVITARDAQLVRLEQHLGVRDAHRRLEPVRGELDREAERVVEVDRVHEASILDAAVRDPALVEPLGGEIEARLGDRQRDVVHAARVRRRAARIGRARLVGEDRDQPPVTRIEVEVALALVVEVRLLEDEGHPEESLPEVDRRLPVGAADRDVVHALALDLSHQSLSSIGVRRASTCSRSAARCPTAPVRREP